jgi:hypothetical protein
MDKHWSGNMFRPPPRKSNQSPRGDNGHSLFRRARHQQADSARPGQSATI